VGLAIGLQREARMRSACKVVFASLLTLTSSYAVVANAESSERACEAGLTIGVPADESAAIVSAVCSAAETHAIAGIVRVAVIGTGGRVTVVMTRSAVRGGTEKISKLEAPTTEAARRLAPSLLGAVAVASTPPPASEPLRPPPVTPKRDAEPIVQVAVEAPDHTLEMSREGEGGWETVCTGTCAIAVPLRASYRFVDARGNVVKGFRLSGEASTTVRLVTRSVALDVLGALAVATGVIAVFGSGASSQHKDALLLSGLALTATGAVVLGTNGSSVRQSPADERDEGPRAATTPSTARTFSASLFEVRF